MRVTSDFGGERTPEFHREVDSESESDANSLVNGALSKSRFRNDPTSAIGSRQSSLDAVRPLTYLPMPIRV